MSDLRDAVARQLALEGESRAMGVDRYRAQRPLPWREAAASTAEEASLAPGKQLLKLAIEPVSRAIAEFVERISSGGAGRRPAALKLLELAPPEEIAYLTARVVVNMTALQASTQAIAFAVADAIIDHAQMVRLKRANRKGYKGLVKSQERSGHSGKKRKAIRQIMEAEETVIRMDLGTKLNGGMKAIELFCEETGLFTLESSPHARGIVMVLRPTEACRDWLERQHARCEVLEPINMPMVIRPRRWRTPFVGGYLTRRPGQRLMKQWSWRFHEEARFIDMRAAYHAVNVVQETPWRINRLVLETMREVWDGGGSLGGLPARDDLPLPAKPDDFETREDAQRAWKSAAAQVHQRNAALLSKRLVVSQRLWIATKFVDEEAIYFPHELDFRGRIYPTPASLTPQGCDADKALLEFAEGERLGAEGVRWLAIHIANLFGVDKVPFDERVAWTLANSDKLRDSAESPLDGARFWTTADSPYCALAACCDWLGYLTFGEDHVSHTPVALDGSNSGLQHFSAMLRDPVGARAVNLLPVERPQDIYSEVAKRAQAVADETPCIVMKRIDKETGEEVETSMPNPWRGGKIARKIAKRPCMTYCYSATRFGMQDMVLQTLREIDAENAERGLPPHLDGADNYAAANWLSHALWDAIADTVQAASAAMAWLRQVAQIVAEADLPIWWTTPMGLPVMQGYRSVHAKRVDVHFGGKRVQLTVQVDGEGVDKRAMANGIAPNFVHSLDAAHLMAVVTRMAEAEVTALALIHDSFGAHAAKAGLLSRVLRETFVEQYRPNRLVVFRDELAAQLPDDLAARLPPPPDLGTLDLSRLLHSDYMFA